ncbi:serine/arginine repetitive matrix protein 1-like [Panicum virgatum]|uniref:serine/arginine repetitive matrix protein 1-like n=1 Tax=Panicum virgatum TaxID=38727 RepID=UPI0019D58BF4|nr:serine/arginine repetitive matrix protein 1-like [Panicum virgatum]
MPPAQALAAVADRVPAATDARHTTPQPSHLRRRRPASEQRAAAVRGDDAHRRRAQPQPPGRRRAAPPRLPPCTAPRGHHRPGTRRIRRRRWHRLPESRLPSGPPHHLQTQIHPGCRRIQPHRRWIRRRSHPDKGLPSPPQPRRPHDSGHLRERKGKEASPPPS